MDMRGALTVILLRNRRNLMACSPQMEADCFTAEKQKPPQGKLEGGFCSSERALFSAC
jgi:hypothetical protein